MIKRPNREEKAIIHSEIRSSFRYLTHAQIAANISDKIGRPYNMDAVRVAACRLGCTKNKKLKPRLTDELRSALHLLVLDRIGVGSESIAKEFSDKYDHKIHQSTVERAKRALGVDRKTLDEKAAAKKELLRQSGPPKPENPYADCSLMNMAFCKKWG